VPISTSAMEHNNNLNNNSNNCSDTPLPIEPNVDEVNE